ncbi:hypothetical protein D9M69_482330 [compost metagenome]
MVGQQGSPVRVLRVGGEFLHQLGCRVNQHLQTQSRAAAMQAFLGDGSTEIAACRIAANRQASRIDTQLRAIFCHPFKRREAIGTACRQVVLRPQAIAHGDHDAIGGQRNAAADAIGGVQIADDEPAAEKPHERRLQLLGIVRLEDAQCDCATRTVDQLLGHRVQRRSTSERKRRQSPALAQHGQRVVFCGAQTRGEVGQTQECTRLAVGLRCA